MKLNMGDKLRQLRRERDLTQEEVAADLGISAQSVSKWERSEGYPDITMLPALARYFGVTADVLLGMSDGHYEAVNALWLEQNRAGRHRENVELMHRTLRDHPGDALLLVQLSTSLEKLGGTKNLQESIAVQEQILRHSTSADVRNAVQYNICHSWWKLGEKARAIELAKQLPNLYKTRENALVYFTDGKDKQHVAEQALTPLAWSLGTHLHALWEATSNIEHLRKAQSILQILFEDELPPSVATVQAMLSSALAQ